MSGSPGNVLHGNPDELPTDPDEVAKLLNISTEGDTAAAEATAGAAPGTFGTAGKEGATSVAGQATQEAPKGAAEGQAGTQAEDQPAGVATRDGKHIIPYEAHAGLRRERDAAHQARQAAERAAQANAERARELEARLTQLEAAKAAAAAGTQTAESQAEIDALYDTLDEELPAVGRAMRAMRAADAGKITKLEATLQAVSQELSNVRQHTDADVARARQTESEMAAEAFDGNPKLRFLHDKQPELYARAVEIDEALRALPSNRAGDRSVEAFAKRFGAVVAALEAEHGAIRLPADYLTQEEIQRVANEKVKGAKPPRPNTLSDLPGGQTPGARPAFENMNAAQLNAATQNLSPDQWDEILSKVA